MKRLLCLYISAILMIGALAGCGGSSSQAPAPSQEYAASSAPAAAAAAPAYDDYGAPLEEAASESAMPLPILTPSTAGGKKMVYTVTLWLQTTGFDAGTRKLLSTAVDMGGYVQSAYINGRDLRDPEIERNATYTFRIPSENLPDFLVVMEDNFTLWRLEQESQDITARSQQTDTRLNDLIEQEKRLKEDIASTDNAREKLSLERQLADVQVSISALDASRVSMDNAVTYSTVTVQLYEVILPEIEVETKVAFVDRLSVTINNSINGFIGFCQGLLLAVIVLLPVIVVLIIFALIALLIVRLVRKHGGKVKRAFAGDKKRPSDNADNTGDKESNP